MQNSPETKITLLEHQMTEVKKEVSELRKETKKGFTRIENKLDCYVTRSEFSPIKSIVYGMVGTILMAFISGLIYLVFK